MTEYITGVELTAEQEARAEDIFQEIVGYSALIGGGEMGAARFIVHLQDALKVANANHERFEREWYLRGDEVERLTESLRQQESQLRAALDELRELGPEGPPKSTTVYQIGDRVKWIKGEAVRTVIAPYNAYRCTEAHGPGETLFQAHELRLVERAPSTTEGTP